MTEVVNATNSAHHFELDPRYTRRLTPEPDGGYTASIHEFPGCIAYGATSEEALENLERAADAWIASARHSGYSIAEPLDFEGASGKIALRISRRVHQMASERAALEGVSLNQLISIAVANYLGQQNGFSKCVSELQENLNASLRFLSSTAYGEKWIFKSAPTLSVSEQEGWRSPLQSDQNTFLVGIRHGKETGQF